jgi:hypothetical protein
MRAALLVASVAAAGVASLTPRGAAADAPKAPPGFVALFNGKDLTGWVGHTTMPERAKQSSEKLAELRATRTKKALEHWKVANGEIQYDGKSGVSLVTEKDYGNFELLIDWKIESKGDSGIYLRGQPQVQVWDSDTTPGARGVDKASGSGGLWNNPYPPGTDTKDDAATLAAGKKVGKIPLKKADRPVGEWNTFHITMAGDKVTVKLNGELVVDRAALPNYWDKGQPLPAAGPIELQHHGDPLWFKNIYLKELPN